MTYLGITQHFTYAKNNRNTIGNYTRHCFFYFCVILDISKICNQLQHNNVMHYASAEYVFIFSTEKMWICAEIIYTTESFYASVIRKTFRDYNGHIYMYV